ncbi:MAG: SPOR domain-containing protein [Acidobacteriota bacterium]
MRAGRRRLRFLVLAVAAVASLMVVASRWAGSTVRRNGAGHPGTTSRAGLLAEAAPDLTFYRALGRSRPLRSGPRQGIAGAPRDAAGAWIVQALVTRDRARARALRQRLAARGLPASVARGRADGRTIYRVRVGRYRERSVADLVARRLRSEHGLDPWVLKEAD